MFNFGISKDSAVKTVRPQLKPWNIYDVKFMGCEIAEGTSKNDPSKSWKRLDIKFENEEGYFNVPLWFPKEGDNERRSAQSKNGGTIAFPSNFEVLMATVAQAAQILNPAGFEKMQAASSKFKSFDDVAKALIQITEKVKGTKTKLKLIGSNYNGKVTTKIPNVLAVSNSGDHANMAIEDRPTYPCDNFIGDKLFFSDYEEGLRAEYLNTKPTAMKPSNDDVPVVDNSADDEELDLESLL
jgi:hypothetical protein